MDAYAGYHIDYNLVWEIEYRAKNSYGTYVDDIEYLTKDGTFSEDWDELYDDIEDGNYYVSDKLDLVSYTFQDIVASLVKEYIQRRYY